MGGPVELLERIVAEHRFVEMVVVVADGTVDVDQAKV